VADGILVGLHYLYHWLIARPLFAYSINEYFFSVWQLV